MTDARSAGEAGLTDARRAATPVAPPQISRAEMVVEFLREQRVMERERKKSVYKAMTSSFLV